MIRIDPDRAYQDPLEGAIRLAVEGHTGQVDKQGKPYILHSLRVMFAGETAEEMIVGVLHDLFEDTTYEAVDLVGMGFPSEIIDALVAITHAKGQTNLNYYRQVKQNPLALRVKRHDIDDNVNRLDTLADIMTQQRLAAKYQRAREVLFGEST